MARFKSVIEILKLLDKSNCRNCGEKTCFAFSAAVLKGQKKLSKCTHLDPLVIQRYADQEGRQPGLAQDRAEAVKLLRQRISSIDLSEAARRLGEKYADGKLTIKCMGKDFSVDAAGNITTDIHVNHWVTMPILCYITDGAGVPASGRWVPFRELKGGTDWFRLFNQMCEKPLKKIADTYTDLFEDMLHIFSAKQVKNVYDSDISIVLHPLPKVPILICYWRPDDGLESSLHIFFDETADRNLTIESIYTLAAGLLNMFKKIALTHGVALKKP
ncbi:MAG TPA: DUF3786 domain-containing protein [Deltaproteobacteria bacterium]|nr:DUF3786 domain-containing protein [Deltaproteobacteria bacterium]